MVVQTFLKFDAITALTPSGVEKFLWQVIRETIISLSDSIQALLEKVLQGAFMWKIGVKGMSRFFCLARIQPPAIAADTDWRL